MNRKIYDLYKLLDQYVESIEEDGDTGRYPSLPEFDLYPDDYVAFAEENLERFEAAKNEASKTNELISCVANLKRALSAQIECFLFAYDLLPLVKSKNISSDKKLKFIADIGLFSSRSINRFMTLRNKVEHEFRKPIVKDIEALFDLVVAAVSILRHAISNRVGLTSYYQIYNEQGLVAVDLNVQYSETPVTIHFCFKKFRNPFDEEVLEKITDVEERVKALETSEKIILEASQTEPDAFCYFLRCLFLLKSLRMYGTVDHIRQKLRVSS